MRITAANEKGQYVKVEAEVGPGRRDRAVFYIRKELWVNMTGDELQSNLHLTQLADVVYDPVTNTIVKNRFPNFDTMIEVMSESQMWRQLDD